MTLFFSLIDKSVSGFIQRLSLTIALVFLVSACGSPTDVSSSNNGTTEDLGTEFQQAQRQGYAELRVLYVPAQGFAYKNEQGELTGVTVELMRDFSEWVERYHDIQMSLRFVEERDWTVFYNRIVESDGGVFGLGNVTITEARKEHLQFSPPYLYNVAVLITPTDMTELQAWNDVPEHFHELSPLAFAGTLHETRIRSIRDRFQPGVDIARVRTNDDIIELVGGGSYYSYIDAYNYWRAVDLGAPVMHHPIGDDSGETFGVIMPHSNDWADLMEQFFSANGGYTQSQGYQDIMQRHLGSRLAETLDRARQEAQGNH